MRYAVEIKLDYEYLTEPGAQALWAELDYIMGTAGFHRQGRAFVSHEPAHAAMARARGALDRLEARRAARGERLYFYIKECLGYCLGPTTDLMAPPVAGIEVHAGLV